MAGRAVKQAGPPPPKLVDLARWLWIASAVVGLARFLVQLADRQMLIDRLRAEQSGLSQDELDAAASGGVVFGLLLGGLLVLVYALLANRMAGGRNWARITLTVFGGVGILVGIFRLLAVASGLAAVYGLVIPPVDLVFGVVTMILDAVALVLMYLPSVSGHFRSQRSVNAQPPQVANGL
ncbi:cytochrome c oxidase subunit IV [Saccharothrix tamanrassetensis]|uniref:Cytochrome c oxidase subunit IV n=1 Tax=Saccharothrix tamanrassetensis TaxID=1051531 RepID=A0A841CFD5_9PSEU|nr:hypothetical protein [Saccharothrix tamanrassetensis]MBB5954725.1 cytochrome c oxidase subunit IV [Saccharothrix tamanrassetensis]